MTVADEKSRADLMMEAAEGFGDAIALATSYRVQLEAAGFSPTAAETVAASWLCDLQRASIYHNAGMVASP